MLKLKIENWKVKMLFPSIKLDDIPVDAATPLNGLAITGELNSREIAGGYVQVSLPLYYMPGHNGGVDDSVKASDLSEMSVTDNETAKAAGLKLFVARWNLKNEWFTPEFTQALRAGQVDGKEKIMYNMNVAGLTRGLFRSIGATNVDFSALAIGSVVGFKASGNTKEPDRLQIRTFYTPKKS